MTDHGDFIWHDVVTPDQKSSGHFLSELLGWRTKEVDAGPFGVKNVVVATNACALAERALESF